MTSSFFKKVLGSYSFTVKGPVSETVRKFQELSETSFGEDNEGFSFSFSCSDKGEISTGTAGGSRYYICGNMTQEGRNTVVTLYEVCNHMMIFWRWLILGLVLTFLIVNMLVWHHLDEYLLVISASLLTAVLVTSFNDKKNAPLDFENMKRQMRKMIEAVERWDD